MRIAVLTIFAVLSACVGLAPVSAPAQVEAEEEQPLAEAPEGEAEVEHDVAGDHDADADHDAAGHEAAEDEGISLVPQRDLGLWSLIVFVALVLVLWKFAWGPLVSGLDQREAGIRNDIAEAEAARAKAAKLLAEHEQRLKTVEDEVREMRSEARATAERMKQEAVVVGQKEAAALVDRAKVEIEQDRRQAEAELRRQLADMVVQAAEQVIRRKLGEGDERRLAEEALSEFTASVR